MANVSRTLQDIDIQAVWDGAQEHGVRVNICIRVMVYPNTRLVLLDKSNPLVECAVVTNIRKIPQPAVEDCLLPTLSSDLVKKSPCASGAEDFLRRRRLACSQESLLATLYKDIIGLESFSPLVAADRWQEIKKESPLVLVADPEVGKGLNGDDKFEAIASREREPTQYPPELNPTLSSTLSVNKYGQMVAADKIRTPRLPWDGGRGDLTTRLRLGLEESPLPTFLQSAGSKFDDSEDKHDSLESDGGHEANSKAIMSRSTRLISSKLGRNLTPCSPCTLKMRRSKQIICNEHTNDDVPSCSPPGCPPVEAAACLKKAQSIESLRPTQILANVEAVQDETECPSSSLRSALIQTSPIWLEEDGKLCFICDDSVGASIYDIDVEATIKLTAIDLQYRQLFWIPGLPRAEVPEDCLPRGGFAFYVEPPASDCDTLKLQFESKTLVDYRIKDSCHIIGRFRLEETPMLSIRTKVPTYHVTEYSATIVTSATLSLATAECVLINYDVRVSCEIPEPDAFADHVDLLIAIRNQPPGSICVREGTCTMLRGTHFKPGELDDGEVLISITRDLGKVHDPMDLSFSMAYSLCSPSKFCVPTFRPLYGKVLSETIILTQPRLPLLLRHLQSNTIRAWKALHSNIFIKLERPTVPDQIRECVLEDALFEVSELSRVSFKDLEATDAAYFTEESVSVARNLQLRLFEIMGGDIGCQIEIDVEVGKSSKILTIDQKGWTISFSLVDGVLATQETGEWRETEDAYLTLFKTDDRIEGKVIHVTVCFQRHSDAQGIAESEYHIVSDDHCRKNREHTFPTVKEKTIIGAMLKSDLDTCTVTLSGLPESGKLVHTLSRHDRSGTHLPRLPPQYHLSFIDQSAALIPPTRLVPLLKLPQPDKMRPAIINPNIVVTSCRRNKKGCIRFGDEVFQQPFLAPGTISRRRQNEKLVKGREGHEELDDATVASEDFDGCQCCEKKTADYSENVTWRKIILMSLAALTSLGTIFHGNVIQLADHMFNSTLPTLRQCLVRRESLSLLYDRPPLGYDPPPQYDPNEDWPAWDTEEDEYSEVYIAKSVEMSGANEAARNTASIAEKGQEVVGGRHSNTNVLDWIDRALGWKG